MSQEEIEDAQVKVIIRMLDGCFLLDPVLTHDAVLAWLESIEAPCTCEHLAETTADNILEASEIE